MAEGQKDTPMTRIKNGTPSRRLTFQDAVRVWIMYWAGEFQNRIAAAFDVNPARISEVVHGRRHPGSEQVAKGLLN